MTVKELIEELRQFDESQEIILRMSCPRECADSDWYESERITTIGYIKDTGSEVTIIHSSEEDYEPEPKPEPGPEPELRPVKTDLPWIPQYRTI